MAISFEDKDNSGTPNLDMEGVLQRKNSFTHSWQERYFKVDKKTFQLHYYKKKGVIAIIVLKCAEQNSQRNYSFIKCKSFRLGS
jgi:hypothetical protein